MTTEQQDRTAAGVPTGGGSGAERRRHVHRMWGLVAPAWAEHAAFTDARHAENTRLMLEITAPRPGDRVLELAGGLGGTGLAAAELVRPGGSVVLSDVAPEMVAATAARVAAAKVTGVRTAVLDLEQVAEPSGSFDVVLCRDGLQFALDPTAAAREVHRVLRPGGRAAVAVWGAARRNPWLSLVFDAVREQVGTPMPPPGLPGPFSLADPDELTGVLRAGGLTSVAVREVLMPVRAASFELWWTRTAALSGPLAAILAAMPAPDRAALRDRLRVAVAPYRVGEAVELPGVGLLATGRVPG